MKEIQIGTGFTDIKFGFTREAVQEILGQPDEKDTFSNSDEPNDQSEVWHYDEIEQSFSFDEIDDWKLASIAGSTEELALNGKQLIGEHFEKTLEILETMDLGEMEIEDVAADDSPDQQVVAFPEKSLNLWFEGGVLTEIQWGPLWDEEKEEPVWPK